MGESKAELLARLRAKIAESRNKRRRDPTQFIPPKAKEGEKLEFYFRVLPPLSPGDMSSDGVVDEGNDLYFYENGYHMVNNEILECPRLHDKMDCPLCNFGFKLMEGNDDKQYRSKVARTYLSNSKFAVNVYFSNTERNPESVRGKVMWFNTPKTIFDVFDETFNNDDEGVADDPKAAGMFYDVEQGYTFKLVVEKQGDYNTYEKSVFLPRSRGPLVAVKEGGGPAMQHIKKILDQRYVLQRKFKGRDIEKLKEMVKKMMATGRDESEEIPVSEGIEKPETETPKPVSVAVSSSISASSASSAVASASVVPVPKVKPQPKASETKPLEQKPKPKPKVPADDDQAVQELLKEIDGDTGA